MPRELVDAGRSGELVLFVGAGASMDSPSSLPSFDKLTEDIAVRASRPLKEGDLEHPDVFLGRLEDEGVRVREMVASRLSGADSHPNRLHRAIVGLAATCPSTRIVTTNFDRHLSAAFATTPITVEEYLAPALPMGDDFEGLVYLHGSLSQEARRLVLTDKDFGAAYLHDAWAARFLERMFRARVVLFIGYSHSDVVMQYFARALGGNTSRYALTPNPEDRNWRAWGITPVGYRVDGQSHEALPIVLEKWAQLASMKRLEHVDRVQEIVSVGIPAVPEEISYLEGTLGDIERIRYFTRAARGTAWLQWAAGRPEFARLSIEETNDELALALAKWVASEFIVDEKLSNAALEIMRPRAWSAQTWRFIAHEVCVHSVTNGVPGWLRPWLALLIERDPEALQDPGDFLTTLLASTDWNEDPGTALMLLDYATQPRLVSRPTLGLVPEPRFDVTLRGTAMQLATAWTTNLRVLVPTHLPAMLAIVDHQLRGAYRLAAAANPTMDLDGISYKRVAIKTIGAETVRDSLDVLIDAGRDLLLQALESHPTLAQPYLDIWADAAETVLVRLAIHGWHHRADQTPSEKLAWLAGRQWLFRPGIQHEVYRLLQATMPEASIDEAGLIIQQALDGPRDAASDPERRARRRFDMISWLAQAAPDAPGIADAYDKVNDEHPDWAPDAPAGINAGTTQNPFQRPSPFTVEQLHSWIQASTSDAVATLEQFVGSNSGWGGPEGDEALRVLEQCTAEYPADGVSLLPLIRERMPLAVQAVIDGWAEASLDDAAVDLILEELAGLDHSRFGPAIAGFLAYGVRDADQTEWHRFERARRLAAEVWTAISPSTLLLGQNLFVEALSSPAGRLAEFWIRAVSHDWRQAGSSWTGVPAGLSSILETMLSTPDPKADHAVTVLASELHFFHSADREWATNILLPLFSASADPGRATLAWTGFLQGGRLTDTLVAELLPSYLAAAEQETLDTDSLRPRIGYHLAWATVYASVDPGEWLPQFAAGSRVGIRVFWARNIARLLKALSSSAADQEWDRWMGTYWDGRTATTQLPTDEASAMAEWIPRLSVHRHEAINLALRSPGNINLTGNLLYEITQADLTDRPADWIRLLDRLLEGATYLTNWMHLREIVRKLDGLTPRPDMTPLIEQALRLKVDAAQQWTTRTNE